MRAEIILDSDGIRELLHSEELSALVQAKAESMAQAAGEGWETRAHDSGQRTIVNVFPATKEAAADNWENNTAERMIESVRE